MAFEVFDKKAVPNSAEAWVTLQKRGNFSFNRKAIEAFGNPEAVELLYDKENKLIGFRPVAIGVPRAYAVRQAGKVQAHTLSLGWPFRSTTAFLQKKPADIARSFKTGCS